MNGTTAIICLKDHRTNLKEHAFGLRERYFIARTMPNGADDPLTGSFLKEISNLRGHMQFNSDSLSTGLVLDKAAFWNAEKRIFRIRLHGSREFVAVAILEDAPLPMAHLDATEHNKQTTLGNDLHERLEREVKAAIARGGHQVATGITLLTAEQMSALKR